MNEKTYSVKDIEQEIYRDFPEMKDSLNFIDPKDFDNIDDIQDFIKPLFIKEAKKKFENMPSIIKDKVENEPAFQDGVILRRLLPVMGLIHLGMPFAQNLSIDMGTDNLAGKDIIIFGGKKDLVVKDIIWRTLIPISSNTASGVDPKIEKEFKTKIEKQYTLPKNLNDNANAVQTMFLDHEVGHALSMKDVKQSQFITEDVGHYMENIADSYSLIRHYQRYGHDSHMGESWIAIRSAAAVMMPDVVHWTSESMEEVIDLNKQGLLNNLSPRETIALAINIAKSHTLSIDESYNIKNAFDTSPLKDAIADTASKAFKNIFNKESAKENNKNIVEKIKNNFVEKSLEALENKEETIKKITDIGMTTKSPAVYRVATSFLNSIDTIWPTLNTSVLDEMKITINNKSDMSTTEPKRPLLTQGFHNLRTRRIRKKFARN